jgi:cyclophilin family peptidyl-prolyl cis-trans isomerase/HEAT repeat protein
MLRCLALVAATCFLIACPAKPSAPLGPQRVSSVALRVRVAQAEARRAGGVEELVGLVTTGEPAIRALALRGLGRIGATGGPRVVQVLTAALGDPSPEVVGAAAGALGLAASLDDGDLGVTDALIAAAPRGGALVIEALGRAGTVAAQPTIVAALRDPALSSTAALALARHGRRKLELSGPSREALIAATASPDTETRYGATYALAREFQAKDDPAVNRALVERLTDREGEIRAQALSGLTKRKSVASAIAGGAKLEPLLLDKDWRVAVEAVRALAETDAGKDAIATALMQRYPEIEHRDPAVGHVIIEGIRAISDASRQPVVAKALAALASSAKAQRGLSPATRGWIECLGIAGQLRAIRNPDLAEVEQCDLPDALRMGIVAKLIAEDVGSVEMRRAALGRLLAHNDARVRAAGLSALAAMWKAGDDNDRKNAMATLVAAFASKDAVVAGAAAEAAPAIYDAAGTADHATLDAAIIARAGAEKDPELGSAMLELVGKRKLTAGLEACRGALAGDPVRAKAGATCLTALGEAAPAIAPAPVTPPAVDVSTVIGKALVWRIESSRGVIEIKLDADAAPWAVATIVQLTKKGFYDGLAFHRVVPNFVAQGGDPTETGSGGPGFAIPAEPSTQRDGLGFGTGGVGMADAGRDSAGSQWFMMHSWGPHLDGRYTWVGTIDSGQKSCDSLEVGDRVITATIEEAAPPPAKK